LVASALALAALSACAGKRHTAPTEVRSLLGRDLPRIEHTPEATERMERLLAQHRANYEALGLEDDAIWVGRRLAYLGRIQESIDWYTARLLDFPASARLYRHRGHRLITMRRFADAELDLARAWELCRDEPDSVEPDGIPNAAGVPVSTLHTNVLYHLGLARYLQGEFARAAEAWRQGYDRSASPDMKVASANWLVLALRRDGREEEARALLSELDLGAELLENEAYRSLLLLQRGERTPEEVLPAAGAGVTDATLTYGIGAWHWCEGRERAALELWQGVVEHTLWNAFGHIAAEAELARER